MSSQKVFQFDEIDLSQRLPERGDEVPKIEGLNMQSFLQELEISENNFYRLKKY